MGRNRTPTYINEVRGTYVRNPARKPKGEPQPREGIGSAPEHLSDEAQGAWDEICDIIPPGVLFCSDRILLEITCNLVAEFRANPQEFKTSRISMLLTGLSRMGLNPSDRGRIVAIEEESVSKEDSYCS